MNRIVHMLYMKNCRFYLDKIPFLKTEIQYQEAETTYLSAVDKAGSGCSQMLRYHLPLQVFSWVFVAKEDRCEQLERHNLMHFSTGVDRGHLPGLSPAGLSRHH